MTLSLRSLLVLLSLFVASAALAQPVVVDGAFDPAEWSGAAVYPVAVNLPGGGVTKGALYLKNDRANLYVAMIYKRPALDASTTVSLEFDSPSPDGVLSHGDDGILLTTSGSCLTEKIFNDLVRWEKYPCPAGALCSFRDLDLGAASQGNGAAGNDGSLSVHEMWHPLASGEWADMKVTRGDKLPFRLFIRLFDTSGAHADTDYPAFGFDTYLVY